VRRRSTLQEDFSKEDREGFSKRDLGHVVGGVRGVYDRHEFKAEKARVLEALATEVKRILKR
jgi:hypothetical protein